MSEFQLFHYSVPSLPTLMSNVPSRVGSSILVDPSREASGTEGVHRDVTYNNSTGTLAAGDGHVRKRLDHLRVLA